MPGVSKCLTRAGIVAIPPKTASLLLEWMELVGEQKDAWVFVSENPRKPVWRDNVWYRHMQPKLEPLGLGWANFQALRRTHASLGHKAGIDPNVSADQRGHGIGSRWMFIPGLRSPRGPKRRSSLKTVC